MTSPILSSSMWHSHLGHIFLPQLKSLCSNGLLRNVKNDYFDCVFCELDKHHTLPFNNSNFVSSTIFDLMHYDIWGLSPIATIRAVFYFVIFVDDFSQLTWIYFMKNHSQLLEIYENFVVLVKTQFSQVIKTFQIDNAME